MLEFLVSTGIKFHYSSSQLQCIDWYWTLIRFFWSARSRIEYLSNSTSWYITKPFLSFAQSNFLLHTPSKWIISTDLHQKITFMTWKTCRMHVTTKVCSLFHHSRSNFSSHWCYMILSIIFLNRWVFPFVNNDSAYLFSHRFSTSTRMFLIQWPTIATDISTIRRKWSKLHVIYFSILIINWTAIM